MRSGGKRAGSGWLGMSVAAQTRRRPIRRNPRCLHTVDGSPRPQADMWSSGRPSPLFDDEEATPKMTFGRANASSFPEWTLYDEGRVETRPCLRSNRLLRRANVGGNKRQR